MNSYNPQLSDVALANITRLSKSAFVPSDGGGQLSPVEAEQGAPAPGGMPPGVPPEALAGGQIPPELAAAAAGGGGALPPPEGDPAAGGPPADPAAPGMGGGSIEEQLASLNAKLDQTIGLMQGFLLGQQSGGSSKGGGGSGGGANAQIQQTLDSIAQALGVQTGAPAGPAGGAPAPIGGGMPSPASAGQALGMDPNAGVSPGGMTVSASDKRNAADSIGSLLKDLRK